METQALKSFRLGTQECAAFGIGYNKECADEQ